MTSTVNSPRHTMLAHVLLVAVTVVWGATFPLVKAALREISPLLFNALRMLLAAILLCALNGRTLRGLSARQWKIVGAAGVCLALGYELQTVGLTYTTPSKSAFLTGLVVVLVPPLSLLPKLHAKGTPKPQAAAYVGALAAFVGIVLLTSNPGAGYQLLSGLHRGEWLTLGCALAYAVHLLILARAAGVVAPRVLGTLQIVAATLVMFVLLPLEGQHRFHATALVGWALAITSILATAAAFTIQSWAQQHLPASHTALILTLEPVFAWLVSLLFLGERLGTRALVGAGCILGGILLSELGPTALSQAAILPLEP